MRAGNDSRYDETRHDQFGCTAAMGLNKDGERPPRYDPAGLRDSCPRCHQLNEDRGNDPPLRPPDLAFSCLWCDSAAM